MYSGGSEDSEEEEVEIGGNDTTNTNKRVLLQESLA